jgi:hypothetical protein
MDKDKFVQNLKRVATRLFKAVEVKYDIYEFGIWTNDDCCAIMLEINTYEHFAQSLKDRFLATGNIVSYNRWIMPEWFKQIEEGDVEMYDLNKRLNEFINIEFEKGNKLFKEESLDMMLKCLLEMRKEGVFKLMKDDFILYIDRVDSWINESMRQRIKQLLNEKQYAEFEQDMKKDFI